MNIVKKIAALFALAFFLSSANAEVIVNFSTKHYAFSEKEKALITQIVEQSEIQVRQLLPSLDEIITVNVVTTDRNVDMVGGVYGRADAPGVMEVTLSTAHKGGVRGAAQKGLNATMLHELHHLVSGWTMVENKYGQQHGIPIAVVNEGLACIFAETYAEQHFGDAMQYPQQAGEWLEEIMALPLDANYSHWVSGLHPDGRSVIGYRVGRYVVHKAMEETGEDILALSKMPPHQILSIVTK